MSNPIRILVVEDDMIIGANIALQLSESGYEVTDILSRGEQAVAVVEEQNPDLILMDIRLKGAFTGIDTARAIRRQHSIPIIFLTANSDEATFEAAKRTRPAAFITKPFHKSDLQRAVALAVQSNENDNPKQRLGPMVLTDRIFVRYHGKMKKLLFKQIHYLEAQRNYSAMVTKERKYMMANTLKSLEAKLPPNRFVRVHRSYLVNIDKLDIVAEDYLEVQGKKIPMSKSGKEILLKRIRRV